MEMSKRRSSSRLQTGSSSLTTSSKSVSVTSRKLLEEKENLIRRENDDNRKALFEKQNLTEFLHEDYFDSGSYRAANIGKPWRSPNLSRRGIHSSCEGSVISHGGGNDMKYSESWQTSKKSRRSEHSSRNQLDNDEHAETKIDEVRLQTANNSNATSAWQSSKTELSGNQSEQSSNSHYNFFTSLFANSNNNASQKKGARLISMWKVGAEDESHHEQERHPTSGRIFSIYGLDNEEASTTRVTRSQTRKRIDGNDTKDAVTVDRNSIAHTKRFRSKSHSSFFSWISTTTYCFLSSPFTLMKSIVFSTFRKTRHLSTQAKVATGAPFVCLVPLFALLMVLYFLFVRIPCYLFSILLQKSFLGSRTILAKIAYQADGSKTENKVHRSEASNAQTTKTNSVVAVASKAASRSRKLFACCPWALLLLLLLLPLLLLLLCSPGDPVRAKVAKESSPEVLMGISGWFYDRICDIFSLLKSSIVFIKDSLVVILSGVLSLFSWGPSNGGFRQDPVARSTSDNKFSQSVIKLIHEHSAQLRAQEQKLQTQKAMLDRLFADLKKSDKVSSNLANQLKQWEIDFKSVNSKLSALDLALNELRKMKQTSGTQSGGVSSKEFLTLSQRVKKIDDTQTKQSKLLESLKQLQSLMVTLEGAVKDQKQSTTVELRKREDALQALKATVTASDAKSVATFKELSEKIIAEHQRLATFDSQQQGLKALLANLEKRLNSQPTEVKDSSTGNSDKIFSAKIQGLEAKYKELNEQLNSQKQEHNDQHQKQLQKWDADDKLRSKANLEQDAKLKEQENTVGKLQHQLESLAKLQKETKLQLEADILAKLRKEEKVGKLEEATPQMKQDTSAKLQMQYQETDRKFQQQQESLKKLQKEQEALVKLLHEAEARLHQLETNAKLQQQADIEVIQRKNVKVKEPEPKKTQDQVNILSPGASTGAKDCKNCPSLPEIHVLIDRALALFAADRIGRPDYALESAGGSIIGTRCTQTYTDRPAVFSLFGVPLFRMSRSPRTVIQPALHPGECWAFRGGKGHLVVRLASDIEISAFTLEHIPKSLAPNERIDSAPRQFRVKGLISESDYDGTLLGDFEYLDNNQPLQTFEMTPPLRVFRYVEFQILSNHGQTEYTCVYRIRVHGKPEVR